MANPNEQVRGRFSCPQSVCFVTSRNGRQQANPPLELTIFFSSLVLFQHALEDEPQMVGVNRQHFIKAVADEFPVTDIVGPWLNARRGPNVVPTGKRPLGGIGQWVPRTIEAVREVGL